MRILVTAFLLGAMISTCHAQVVEDTNLRLITDGFREYGFELAQDAGDTDHTCAAFDWNNGTVEGEICLDEGAEWFLANLDDEFSATTLGANVNASFPDAQFPLFFGSQQTLTDGDEFYVATVTPLADFGVLPDAYGWAKLQVVGNSPNQTLAMVDNAVAYGVEGIFVGTSRIVPEPSAIALLLGGLVLVFRQLPGKRE